MVIVGYDGHDSPGTRAGMVALDAASGEQRWNFDSDRGGPATGCGGVWSSPSVDTDLGLVFAGTANCPSSPAGWNAYSEAIFAVDLAHRRAEVVVPTAGTEQQRLRLRGRAEPVRSGRHAGRRARRQGRRVLRARPRHGEARVEARPRPRPRVQAQELLDRWLHRRDRGRRRVRGRRHRDRRALPVPARHHRPTTARSRGSRATPRPRYAPSAIVNGVAFAGSTTDFTLRAVDLNRARCCGRRSSRAASRAALR